MTDKTARNQSKSNPFDQQPNAPGTGQNTVDPATNASGPPPMPAQQQGVNPSVATGTEGWGLGKDEPSTSGQPGRNNNIDKPTDNKREDAA
jgi:hypothetical protein